MTRVGYIIAKALTSLGISRIEKHRTNAAFETHLLRDSEMVVGELAWFQMENIEEISSEYWKLRKLTRAENELREKVEKLTDRLEESQDARAQALEKVEEATKQKVTERDGLAEKMEQLLIERDKILRDGRAVKRTHSGLKTKLEVLREDSNNTASELIESTQAQLKEKRMDFERFKERRAATEEKITDVQQKLEVLNTEIEKENESIRKKAEEQFGTIGKTNKELSSLRGKIGLIDTEKSQLYAVVGHYIISNSREPEIRKAAKKHHGLLSLIEEVRLSSYRHQRLIGD